jgi:uncharacterized protein (DUF1501 family)
MGMKRRDFLKAMSMSTAALSMGGGRVYAADEYTGRCLITLQARGGWDTASFCDPKENVPGELEITRWSNNNQTRQAGNIRYAPYADNAAFFDKYYRDMLVINGLDAQTNAHGVGIIHNWSGRNSAGYPSLAALHAAVHAPEIPLSNISFGGFSDTARLLRYTRLSHPGSLSPVLAPNLAPWGGTMQNPDAISAVEAAQQAKLQRMLDANATLPLKRYNALSYLTSLQNSKGLEAYADVLPPVSEFPADVQPSSFAGTSNLKTQMMLSVLAFKAGVASSAGLYQGGFDTHSAHDADHMPLLSHLTDSLDFLWNYAEEQGVADRITLVIGSEFGRTPYYNSGDGKDHWPIGSMIIMEKDAAWGNRVVGLTDEGQNTYNINPTTLQRDDASGTHIYPKHVHKALRRYLGIENTAVDAGFPFSNTEDFDFFNPSLSTV